MYLHIYVYVYIHMYIFISISISIYRQKRTPLQATCRPRCMDIHSMYRTVNW